MPHRFTPLSLALLLLATPLLIAAGHDGMPHPRTGPEVSDAALFVFAVLAVWLTRRALRKRGIARTGRSRGTARED